ncbi:hypothetical protein HYT60_01580 [Candidatus Woesebacteria bacterium]|nr:hypothetical protein [Candidatus Woesebacteria bacterium]
MQSAFGDRSSSIRGIIGKIPLIYIAIAIVSVFSVAVIVVGSYIINKSPKIQELLEKARVGLQTEENKNIAEPFKPAPRPLATGKQTYSVSGSTPGSPKIAEAIVDPIDPARGTSQKWTLKVLESNDKSVKEVYVTVMTDNKKTKIGLKKIGGSEQDGVWEGTGRIDDSYDYTYQALLFAKNDVNLAHTLTLTFR